MVEPANTKTIKTSFPEALEQTAEVLSDGGLVAFPTDTVYGLGASLTNPKAIARLFQVKSRPKDRPIPVLMADTQAAASLGARLSSAETRLADAFWPGPLTIVVKADRALAARLGGIDSIGVRVPDHSFAQKLLAHVGPMAVTSANLSGQASAATPETVAAQLAGKIDLILDGGRAPGGQASTVVRCRDSGVEILRQGPLLLDQIERALQSR